MVCRNFGSIITAVSGQMNRKCGYGLYVLCSLVTISSTLNVIQLIKKYNYPVEEHVGIKTQDDYLLTIHRIPFGRKGNSSSSGKDRIVFLMHGLMSSSVDWINMGPEKSIGFLLADRGYDVWMGNARGTTWSKKHVTYDPNRNSEFWNFSWHEIGIYDLPAMIDYILNITKRNKIFYIGHSQGTTSSYVLLSERPNYNRKIRLLMSFAPVAYMSHLSSPFKRIMEAMSSLEWIPRLVGIYELTPNKTFPMIDGKTCQDQAPFQEVCSNLLFLLGGYDSEQLNRSMLPVIFANSPTSCSVKQALHYGQEIKSGEFRQYDYGLGGNKQFYGQRTPPKYILKNIIAPVGLFYSENDNLAAVKDVLRLAKELPNVVYKYDVPLKSFSHIDFLWAIDVVRLLYNSVFALMNKY